MPLVLGSARHPVIRPSALTTHRTHVNSSCQTRAQNDPLRARQSLAQLSLGFLNSLRDDLDDLVDLLAGDHQGRRHKEHIACISFVSSGRLPAT